MNAAQGLVGWYDAQLVTTCFWRLKALSIKLTLELIIMFQVREEMHVWFLDFVLGKADFLFLFIRCTKYHFVHTMLLISFMFAYGASVCLDTFSALLAFRWKWPATLFVTCELVLSSSGFTWYQSLVRIETHCRCVEYLSAAPGFWLCLCLRLS